MEVFNRLAWAICFVTTFSNSLAYNVQYQTDKLVALPKDGKNASRFFGSFFEIEKRLNKLMITCPGCTENPMNASLPGRIYRCHLIKNESCVDVSPTSPPTLPQDGFGIAVGIKPASGTFVACATLRQTLCKTTVHQLGHCYLSNNYGKIWKEALTQTVVCPHSHVDILFLLDGSSSINIRGDNFKIVKEWVKNVTRKFDISQGGSASVGVVQYSTWLPQFGFRFVVTEIDIGEYTVFSDFSNALDRIVLQAGTTFTGTAIPIAAEAFKNSSYYDDPHNKKVMILLTDGESVDPHLLNSSSMYLKSQNITAISVGVGAADLTELQIVANGQIGNNDRVHQLTDFSKLDSIVQSIFTEIRASVLEGSDSDQTNELRFGEYGFSTTIDSVSFDMRGR